MSKARRKVVEHPCLQRGCGKVFASWVQLRKHQDVHTKNVPCRIGACIRRFANRADRDAHERVVHRKDYDFPCLEPGCGKRFTSTKLRSTHKATMHRPDGPAFVCQVCDKLFRTKAYHDKHILTHTQPFKCGLEGCVLAFSSQRGLDQHLAMHDKREPTVCPHADRGCEYKGFDVKQHVKRRCQFTAKELSR